MKKIMLIASAMSALSLPFSASAIELGDEGGLECGPYAKVGVVGGIITGVESARLDPADTDGKKLLPLTTSMPFGGTLAAGMTIAQGFRAELGVMYLTNITAQVEEGKVKADSGGKTKADSGGEIKADSGGGTDVPIRKRFKLTPPQPTIMPISIADRDFGIDIRNIPQAQAGNLNNEQRAAARIAWLKNCAGIDYRVKNPNNPNGPMVINPILLNIPQGNPIPVGNQRAQQPAAFAIHDHEQWRYLVTGLAALSNANKPSASPVKVLSDKITQIYSDIKLFADIAGIDVPDAGLPNSATVEQIQNKMQELNNVLEELRESFEGYLGGNAFANQIQLNFVMPQQAQQQQGQGQQQQAQATVQEAVAAAAVRLLNGNDQIAQLYRDLVKLQRHAGIKKAMEKLAAQQEEDAKNQGEGDCKQQQGASEKSKKGKDKEAEFDLSMIVGQVKLYADLFATESFSIYAGLGAGLAYTYGKIDNKDIKGHTGMVASGALGVAINAAEGVYVDIEGSYMYSFSKIEEKYSINPLMASFGVRYNF
uniref:56 kDa type-specific antigen n=4 Tax=Orientia tsutsugamushi TaxID=784 RepID=W8SVP3_ORITS|nr:56-kDa type-specific antigen [Orientia tsutsugamushi]AHM22948.1 56-kDa type-specific antigen [Orientia tsutsugamushi]